MEPMTSESSNPPSNQVRAIKKGCAWISATLLSLIGLVLAAVLIKGHVESRARITRLRDERSRVKVRVGDDTKTVRLRLGIPDTIVDVRSDTSTLWFYRTTAESNQTFLDPNVISFSSRNGRLTVDAVIFTLNRARIPWTPEDELTPTEYDNADDVLALFSKALGPPCHMFWSDDSTMVYYRFRISQAELAEDSMYRRLVSQRSAEEPIRALNLSLRAGKKVDSHGWLRGGDKWCVK